MISKTYPKNLARNDVSRGSISSSIGVQRMTKNAAAAAFGSWAYGMADLAERLLDLGARKVLAR